MIVPFSVPTITGLEEQFVNEVMSSRHFAGGGVFASRCVSELERILDASSVFLTTSCTDALEMAALLCDIEPGDEVILPSFAFPSTATAFVRCGARVVFVDVDPVTLNMDPEKVADAVSSRTKAVVALHYAGAECEMNGLKKVCDAHQLLLIEDAAQCIGTALSGPRGDFVCYSFHQSKNLHCGEGGALVVNNDEFKDRAEIVFEKGTDRRQMERGEIARYQWRDIGSSFILSELNAAFLLPQLEAVRSITSRRLRLWTRYRQELAWLESSTSSRLPEMKGDTIHNGHIFWLIVSPNSRDSILDRLRNVGIGAVVHYVPLHSAAAGMRFGEFRGEDRHTTTCSSGLIRLPLFDSMTESQQGYVIDKVSAVFRQSI